MKSFREVAGAGENTLISHLLSEERKRKRERLCPKGHHYNRNTKRCEPNTDKDSVTNKGDRDSHPRNGAPYRTWGRTGIDGDGYAYAEPNGWGDGGGGGMGDHGGGGGCSSCSEEAQPDSPYDNPYNKAQEKSTKQANRRSVSKYRVDGKRKGVQKDGMSVHEDILALRLEAKRAKDVAPSERLEIPLKPENKEFVATPVHQTDTITKGRSKGTRKPLALNPKPMKEAFNGCPRCGTSKCRCLGNRVLIDNF